jgi:hypothetical protein
MTIRNQFVEKWNYTGRKRIRQKPELFTVEALSRTAGEASFTISWDLDRILAESRIDKSARQSLVIDAMFMGNTRRFELDSADSEQTLLLQDCPDDAMIDFRLKLVSAEAQTMGALLAATSWFKLQPGTGDNHGKSVSSGFFDLKISDSMGEQVWKINWKTPDEPEIFVNRKYYNKYNDSAVLRCHLFPEILRGILLGLVFRNDDLDGIEEGTPADDWLIFVEQRLGQSLRGEQAAPPEEPEGWLNLIDEIIQVFVEKRWANGKSLLEELV